MNRIFFIANLIVLGFVFTISCQTTNNTSVNNTSINEIPAWVTSSDEVWIEDGIIFARGFSASRMSLMTTRDLAETNAIVNLTNANILNEISGNFPISGRVSIRSSVRINDVNITVNFGEIRIRDEYYAKDETVYVLISCNGIEIVE